MENIQQVSDNLLCSACGACNAICPKGAISFEWTNIGRKHAKVALDKCVQCGLCSRVCPSLDSQMLHNKYEDPLVGTILATYIGRSTNREIYTNAQSGGVCTAILTYLFETKKIDAAIVCRMSYGDRPVVEGVIIEDFKQLKDCQKSCYTPVDILSALKNCKEKKSVAVVGIPCQIEGLVNLGIISPKFRNITYKIGLVCDGTMCATVMDVMKSYQKEKNIKIEWRKKFLQRNGEANFNYAMAPVCVSSANGAQCIIPKKHRTLIKQMFTAPRCKLCYDKINVHADIVLGDPWGMNGYDKVHGDNVITVRTDVGKLLVEEMNKSEFIVLSEASTDEFIKGQKIEMRRQLVTDFSNALRDNLLDSYLYHQNYAPVSSSGRNAALKKVRDFQRLEELERADIVGIARKKIAADQKIVKRIGRFIKRLFK